MSDTIIAVYDTAAHTELAIAALRRAGVPDHSIHRHIRDGDDLTSEKPALVQTGGSTLWSSLFGGDDPVEHIIYDDSAEAGGTVIRVSLIPPEHYGAVLAILERFHPADLKAGDV